MYKFGMGSGLAPEIDLFEKNLEKKSTRGIARFRGSIKVYRLGGVVYAPCDHAG